MFAPTPKPEILKSIHSFILEELIPPTAKHLVFLGSISLIALKVFGPILEAGKNFKASAPELSANNASEAVKHQEY